MHFGYKTMNIALLVSYDGTELCGWQVQKKGRTVQGEIEGAIARAFSLSVRVTGSGRTDAACTPRGRYAIFLLKKA